MNSELTIRHVKKIVVTGIPAQGGNLYLQSAHLCALDPGDTTLVIADMFREIWRKETLFWSQDKAVQELPVADRTTSGELLMLVLNNIDFRVDGATMQPPDTLRIYEMPVVRLNTPPTVTCEVVE